MNNFGNNWHRYIGLGLILIFVFLFGSFHLSESPQIGYDEGILIQMAGNFFERGAFDVQVAPDQFISGAYMTTAYPVLFPVAVGMRMFGANILTARAVMLVFLLAFITAFYFTAEQAFGRRKALLSTTLMATHASLFVYGKSVLGEIPGLFFLTLFVLGMSKLEREMTRPLPLVIATSVALGLAAVTKPIFLIVLPAAGITLFLQRKKLPVNFRTVCASVITLLLCAGIWFLTQFSLQDDAASVLQFYRDPYQATNVGATVVSNLLRFVTETTPIFVAGLLLAWTISFFLRIKKRSISSAELFCFCFVVLVLLAYLRTPGFYRYFFVANAVIYLSFPFALEEAIRLVVEKDPKWKAAHVARDSVMAICFLLILGQGYRLMHGSFISTTYGYTQTAELERYFATDFDSQSVPYLYDVPDLVPFLPTKKYTQFMELSGGGVFSYGTPRDEALANNVEVIAVTGKRLAKELDAFTAYHETAHVGRYVFLKRNVVNTQPK